ncbi:MAG: hypothetical protein AB7P04_03570 [Bacteriovoracia bacterium]
MGRYVCADYAYDYCKQFIPQTNCFYLDVRSAPLPLFWHAINLIRVDLGDGNYMYCAVEPQDGKVVPGSCFVKRKDWNPRGFDVPFPREFYRALCEYYESWGMGCSFLPNVEPYPIDEVPGWMLHRCCGGWRDDWEGCVGICPKEEVKPTQPTEPATKPGSKPEPNDPHIDR